MKYTRKCVITSLEEMLVQFRERKKALAIFISFAATFRHRSWPTEMYSISLTVIKTLHKMMSIFESTSSIKGSNICCGQSDGQGLIPRSPRPVSFCLLSGVGSGCARPVAGRVIEVTCRLLKWLVLWLAGCGLGLHRARGACCDRLSSPQALHRPSHTRHSHHAGSGVGCVMYILEGTKRSSGPAGNFARNSRRTA